MATAATRNLNVLVGVALLANVVLFSVEGLPETRFQVSLSLLLGTIFCLLSSFALFGPRIGVLAFVASYVLSWVAEVIGVHTGLIFGAYRYTDVLGIKLAGVPLLVPIFWYLFLYTGYVIASLVMKYGGMQGSRLSRLLWLSLFVALIVTDYDLAFDPHASYKLKAWEWLGMNPGKGYFGVPLHNYYGWVGTAFVLALVLQLIRGKIGIPPLPPRTKLTILAPVVFYTLWWLAYAWDGYPDPVRVVAMIALGIPALAAVVAWNGLTAQSSDAEEIAQAVF